jgi:hypothetical protein
MKYLPYLLTVLFVLVSSQVLSAQSMEHTPGMQHGTMAQQPATGAGVNPVQAGQGAYGAIAEVVQILDADAATDWAAVNIERLRQHLVAMDEVTLNASVRVVEVPGGAQFDVTGSGRTLAGIREMLVAHTGQLNTLGKYRAATADIGNGVRWTVTAIPQQDGPAVNRIRGLGFMGLLTIDNHHGPHHLAMARGGSH